MSTIKAGFNPQKDEKGNVIGAKEITLPHRNPYEAAGLKRPTSQVPVYIRKKRSG